MKLRSVLFGLLLVAVPIFSSEDKKKNFAILCGVGVTALASIWGIVSWYAKVTKKPVGASFPYWYENHLRENILNFASLGSEGEVQHIEYRASQYELGDVTGFSDNETYKSNFDQMVGSWDYLTVRQKVELNSIFENLLQDSGRANTFFHFLNFVREQKILYQGMDNTNVEKFNQIRELFREVPAREMVKNNTNPFWATHLPRF